VGLREGKRLSLHELRAGSQFHGPKKGCVFYFERWVDGVGGVGAVVAMEFHWIVIRRRGDGIVPMPHGFIVRR